MVASRILGSTLIVMGLAIASLTLIYAWVVNWASWPGLFRTIAESQAFGPVPTYVEWFLMALGLGFLFYGSLILSRMPWTLLASVVLCSVLCIFVLLAAGMVVFPTSAVHDGILQPSGLLREENQVYRYSIAAVLTLLAAILAYSTFRLHGSENRFLYAEAYMDVPPLTPICNKCGRILIDDKCPVHDRPSIAGLLVRNDTGEEFPVTQEVSSVGRDPNSQLIFDKSTKPEYSTIARKQAQIVWDNGSFYIANVSQKNPTQVDGRALPVPPGQDVSDPVPLSDGSQVVFGTVQFTFYTDATRYKGRA
jgi:hypothetical protein